MESSHIESKQRSRGTRPRRAFFYTNFPYLEVAASLRYGIEARKGLIVVTGAEGLGKTTLLHRVVRELESNVRCVSISNPPFDFDSTELLRHILRDLGIAQENDSRLEMIHRLKRCLVEQFENRRIVTLLLDDAQNLGDQVLEHAIGLMLLCQINDKDKLLQVVLVGRPELERKLDQPRLAALKRHVAFMCRLTPLPEIEVGPYIGARVQTVRREGEDLFDSDAIEQIATYSQGIPRRINTLCDSSLRMARKSAEKKVSAEIIRDVAMQLELNAPGDAHSTTPVPEWEMPKENEKRFHAPAEKVGQTCLPLNARGEPNRRDPVLSRLSSHGGWVLKIVLALVFGGGAGAAIYGDRVENALSYWNNTVGKSVRSAQQHVFQAKQEGNASQQKAVQGQDIALSTEKENPAVARIPAPGTYSGSTAAPSGDKSDRQTSETNPAITAAASFLCVKGSLDRRILVDAPSNEPGYACRVIYAKENGVSMPWYAEKEQNYCGPKAAELVTRHVKLGWSCFGQ